MGRLIFLGAFLFMIFGGSGPALAGPSGERPEPAGFSLPELITLAYENNPEIRAARANWRAEFGRHRVSVSYPDPQLQLSYFNRPIETRLGPQDWNVAISQAVPFPGKLSKAGELVEADLRIARLKLDKTIRDTITELRLAFYELSYLEKARAAADENRRLLAQIRKKGETAYAEGEATLNDVVRSQSQLGRLRYDQLLLAELAETERVKINTILNRPPESVIGELADEPLLPLAYGLEEIYRLAENSLEEIKIAAEELNKAAVGRELAAYRSLPDFKVGLFYAGIGEPDSATKPQDAGRDAMGVQVGMSIPLWIGRNRGYREQAGALLLRARELEAVSLNKSRAAISRLYFRLNNAGRLVKLYAEDLLPQALAAINTAETWYREGQGSFADYIETQTTVYNFQLSLARARADYGKYLARLEALAGRKLTSSQGGDSP